MSVENVLRDEIKRRAKELETLKMGTEEHRIAMDSYNKLVASYCETVKATIEAEQSRKKVRFENVYRIVDYGLKAATLGVGIWTFVETLKFDGHAICSSTNGRKIMGGFLPDFKKLN